MRPQPCRLPLWETFLHCIVSIVMFTCVWRNVYSLSQQLPSEVYASSHFAPGRLAFLGPDSLRDVADFEWTSMARWIPVLAMGLACSSALHWALSVGGLGGRAEKGLSLAGSLAIVGWLIGPQDLLVNLAQVLGYLLLVRLLPWRSVVWCLAAGLFYHNTAAFQAHGSEDAFLAFIFLQYSLFHCASYSLDVLCEEGVREGLGDLERLLDALHYVFYLPYKGYLIMPFGLFARRWEQRRQQPVSVARTAVYAVRLVGMYWAMELLTHVVYLHPLAQAWDALPKSLRESRQSLLSVYFALGGAFHLKYAVIWGVLSVPAELDGMRPLAGPVCVWRVGDYGRMWREFDRGLYIFVRRHLYEPIARPTFSSERKLAAGVAVFAVVLVWHEVKRSTLAWIGLNGAVLLLKGIGNAAVSANQASLDRRLSPLAQRRWRGILHAPLVILSIFGVGYFLGGAEFGDCGLRRLFWEDWARGPTLNAAAQMATAYSFGQLCTETELWIRSREQRKNSSE